MQFGAVALRGTTVSRLAFLVCTASAANGYRLMISGSLNPAKPQNTKERGLG
jgi:hypothetical protein